MATDNPTRLRIPLVSRKNLGLFATVDASDEWLLGYEWHPMRSNRKGRVTWYVTRFENGKTILMHRQLLAPPDGVEVDHKDNDGLHNWRENLRLATRAQNARNMSKALGKTSRYLGVSWHRGESKWRAYLTVGDRQIAVGYFRSEAAAAAARDARAVVVYGAFAKLNLPPA